MIGQDKTSYSFYFKNGIHELILDYERKYADVLVCNDAEERIWNAYCDFNAHCKKNYMSSEDHLLDRHKVVACYIYAIEKAYVLSSVESIKRGDSTNLYMNEEMAFCFGLSLLRALICDVADKVEFKEKIKTAFEGDVQLPECTHGDFKNNFLAQLRFTRIENNYNILSLAESLYLIECYNLVLNELPTDALKLSIPE